MIMAGRYRARLADGARDLADAQALRARAFRTRQPDCDAHDRVCQHVLVRDCATDQLVCCFRLLILPDGAALARSYSAQFYDLTDLQAHAGPMAELGRFCVHPERSDPDILRVAWALMTRLVDQQGISMLFGCSSFAGLDTKHYLDAFAVLKARHLAPKRWLPQIKAPDVFRFAARVRRKPDLRKGMLQMPPLLRSYLMMGGRVSDHAVVDRQLNTLHVFTGLEICAIPASRKRLLRVLAG